MKRRCRDVNFKDYPKYGGRGVIVCPEWDKSFIQFLADMGERPSLDHSIDRLDSNGNYEAGNCRWATSIQQATENKRDLKPVTIDGIYYPNRSAACKFYGITPTTVSERMKRGISIEEAITTPTRGLVNKRSRESYIPKDRR